MGWYGLALIRTLEALPSSHPRRPALRGLLERLVRTYVHFADPETGRWFQVFDGKDHVGAHVPSGQNWTETSASSMATYVIARALELELVANAFHAPAAMTYRDAAVRGYQGVLERLSLGSDGRTDIRQTSVGTSVGSNATYYLDRRRALNDLHAEGAFLLMYEQLGLVTAGAEQHWLEAEEGLLTPPLRRLTHPDASGRRVIEFPRSITSLVAPPQDGAATFRFSVAKAGRYKLWGRLLIEAHSQDALWVRIDDQPFFAWGALPVRLVLG
jgi:hypothetical protein